MHLLTIPPGKRAKAHVHENHETAIYALSGETHCWYGDQLEHHRVVREGEMFYIPTGVPHLPANLSDKPPRPSSPAPTRTSRKAWYCCRSVEPDIA